MAKKRKQEQRQTKEETASLSVSDALNDDVLSKLKAAKQALKKVEVEEEEARQTQLKKERKEREKNKTFEELFAEYGDRGSKY